MDEPTELLVFCMGGKSARGRRSFPGYEDSAGSEARENLPPAAQGHGGIKAGLRARPCASFEFGCGRMELEIVQLRSELADRPAQRNPGLSPAGGRSKTG